MSESTTKQPNCHFTARASLVALGLQEQKMGLFQTIGRHVHIAQKTIRYTPTQKLKDAFITILAGAKGLVEANKRLRPDRAVQAAFGRFGCAEQSVISETLSACTPDNVQQLDQALQEIYQAHSRAYRHDYAQSWQLLDVDLTGQPCGRKAAFATKGYFAKLYNRRGRQLGRVLATRYEEVVVDRIYAGSTSLPAVLQELVQRAEAVLGLDEAQRRRTLVRMDAHGGSQDDVNWLLARGYQLHTKEYSGHRIPALLATVTTWHPDPRVPGREVGAVTAPATEYVRPLRRIAVRTPKKNGQWATGVILSTLTAAEAVQWARLPQDRAADPVTVLLAYVYVYDQRGGGIETEFKEDKQGLGITKRNKKRFAAQQMLVGLNALAHNLVVWAREWLTPAAHQLRRYGLMRMIRDVFHVRGLVHYDAAQRICAITFDDRDPLAPGLCRGFQVLLEPLHVAVNLGEI